LLRQKPVYGAAKPLGSVLPLSRWVFSAQDGARQKLKTCPEPSGNKLSESFLKILHVVCSSKGNGNVRVINFLENDEIVFYLAAMTQCEQGVRVILYIGLKLMRIR
jgi:hypothetical protein